MIVDDIDDIDGPLVAPFPWFGGKRPVADIIWRRLGDVPNYVEPFFGSGAVLLNRPHAPKIETVNDLDGFIANFWRAVTTDPEQVAHYTDWPVNENDLHARHVWLKTRRGDLQAQLEGDPDYYDPKIAGWWVWGICAWIGGSWCETDGPWVVDETGRLVNRNTTPDVDPDAIGVNRQLPHLGNAGRGVHRIGISRQRPHLCGGPGQTGQGVHVQGRDVPAWFTALAERLRRVRVCCGDWSRICGPSPTTHIGLTGVLLDPPYDQTMRCATLYTVETNVSAAVRDWAITNGDNPRLRIALCGIEDEHCATMPPDWTAHYWRTQGGYSGLAGRDARFNRPREVIWFSPHCLPVDEYHGLPMFAYRQDSGE
jgi:hypothetical protein